MLALVLLLLVQEPGGSPSDLGVVTGRVLNVDGKPASGVRVAAMTFANPGIANEGSLLAFTATDTAGRYLLEKVPPGRYYIIAGLLDAPSYFPGTATQSDATVVEVIGGTTINKIDLTMVASAGFRVSGRLRAKPTLPHSVNILLISQNGAEESPIQPDGTFEFRRVLPGSYKLAAAYGLPILSFVVTDHDVRDLEMGNRAGVRILGKLSSREKTTFAGSVVLTRTELSSPATSDSRTAPTAAANAPPQLATIINSDGSFEFLQVPPGRYSILVMADRLVGPILLDVQSTDITGFELKLPY